MIPREYIQELQERTDITELISESVQLKRSGRMLRGLCPFHSEKTPSFFVYPNTSSFYCFGCGAGGDAIKFVEKMNNLSYVEAVKFLASRAGMPMPEEDDEAGRLKGRILAANRSAAKFYFSQLNTAEGTSARKYLRGRGLSDDTIRRFGLGYSPADSHATAAYLKKQGFTEQELLAAGIVRSGEYSPYDFFRARVMYPIFDLRGNVIAFGGRRIDGLKTQKYINTPDTPVFKKSRNIFALNLAKNSKSRRFILCEGYMDVISLHQSGFDTAIAPLGTALTKEQILLLSAYIDELVICLDSDAAGQKGTNRALGLLEGAPFRVTVISVPEGKDPDEFIRSGGAEKFRALLEQRANTVEYRLACAKANYDLAKDEGRVGYLRDAVGILSDRMAPTEREVYMSRVAKETDIDRSALKTQIDSALRVRIRRAQADQEKSIRDNGVSGKIRVSYAQGGQKALGVAYAEQQLIAASFSSPRILQRVCGQLKPDDFITPQMRDVFELLAARTDAERGISLSSLSGELPDETMSLLSRVLAQNYDVGFSDQDVEMYLARVRQGTARSTEAGNMDGDQLGSYLEQLRENKE